MYIFDLKVDKDDAEECEESLDLNNKFPIIAGAKWEFTNDWDCGGNDIGSQTAPSWDGTKDTIDGRADCAQKCLDVETCVAFNYPEPGNGNCWWKHSYQKSTKLDKTCGSASGKWQYYTLLERNAVCVPHGKFNL